MLGKTVEENLKPHCSFVGVAGDKCLEALNGHGTKCYWHDASADKTGPEVKEKLEEWANSSKSMEGFILRGANLNHLKFSKPQRGTFINLMGADLYHATVQDAHMYAVNFSGASLMKTDFLAANLNRCNFTDVNLLGTKLHDTKLEGVSWGKICQQERNADKARAMKQEALARKLYIEAEEIYRTLYKESEARGLYHEAGRFFYREQVVRRSIMQPYSSSWWISHFVDLFCGYGESPAKVVVFSSGIILLCAFLYLFCDLQGSQGLVQVSSELSFKDNIFQVANILYFSVVTFTTLGYGDIAPLGGAKLIAALEAFFGGFIMALFVVVFVKKMTR